VDLLECLTCERRFIVDDAGDGHGWLCPSDGGELGLVIRSLPGTLDEIEEALKARLLGPTSRSERELADQARRRHDRQMERITRDYLAETAESGREMA
jgi:hypothetical protein